MTAVASERSVAVPASSLTESDDVWEQPLSWDVLRVIYDDFACRVRSGPANESGLAAIDAWVASLGNDRFVRWKRLGGVVC